MQQLDIFDFMFKRFMFKKEKPIRLVELFSGIGFQRMALELAEIPYEVVGTSEIDRFAIEAYEAIHGDNHNLGSITDITGKDMPRNIDLMTYSFPCFTADTLIMTSVGYKKIIDVAIGDLILTHDNTFKKVLRTLDNGKKETMTIKGMGIHEITTTPNHKFYTRKMYRKWNKEIRNSDRLFKKPKWVEAKNLTKQDYLGVAINQNSKLPEQDLLKEHHTNDNFWWIVGRFLADGWVKSNSGIMISCGKHKIKELEEVLGRVDIKYSVYEERTAYKIYIGNKEWNLFFKQFGHGADNKKITNTIFDLPREYLKYFVEGYMAGDGSFTQGVYKSSSVSKELTYGIAQCVAKVYQTPYRIYKHERKSLYNIEGRTGKQLPAYQLVYKKEVRKQDKAFYEDGFIWFPIQAKEKGKVENVYDLEVEKNHSYTANGVIVHNCTDLSKAGTKQGMGEGTRSGLVYEVLRILDELKEIDNLPKVLVMENVPDLIQAKFINEFNSDINRPLEVMGYTNYVMQLNAKDFGVAQNRDRVFMVSILGDYNYIEPKPFILEKRLKDYLDDKVDKDLYLPKETIEDEQGFFKDKGKHIEVKECTLKGYKEAYDGDGIYLNRPNQKRGVVQKGMIQTLKTSYSDLGVVLKEDGGMRIRKLSPNETGKLMGMNPTQISKQLDVVSNSQAYKQHGNGIVAQVLGYVIGMMYYETFEEVKQKIESNVKL